MVPEAIHGISAAKLEEHSWKGLEIRESVYKKRGLIHDALSNVRAKLDSDHEPVTIKNSTLILLDAPHHYTSYDNLEDIYQADPKQETENELHHQFGAALLSDPKKQGHVLLFNRVLQNAIERGVSRGGIDMDDARHTREMITQVPWQDNTPETMREKFSETLDHAFLLGGLEPFTEQSCDIPTQRLSIAGVAEKVTGLIPGK